MPTPWHQFDYGADFYIKAPISFEMMRFLAQNPQAIAEGAVGAPRINRRAIHPGGALIDAGIVDSTAMPSESGFYEFDELNLTTTKTLPTISIIRIDGDCVLSGTLNAKGVAESDIASLVRYLSAKVGDIPSDSNTQPDSGGGSSIGDGGHGRQALAGSNGYPISSIYRPWVGLMPIIGAPSGIASLSGPHQAKGGGCIILLINGDFDCTGGIMRANGDDGTTGASYASGGGGGGSVIVICNGTITGGTFTANGGDGRDSSSERGGGGGGGYVALVAAGFSGVQTISVTGGASGGSGAAAGSSGNHEKTTLTEHEINGLMLR